MKLNQGKELFIQLEAEPHRKELFHTAGIWQLIPSGM